MSRIIIFVLLLSGWLSPGQVNLQGEEAVVRAVLFYSPTCGHCEYVITEVLPPLNDEYGDRLQILGINIGETGGYAMFVATLQQFNLESGGVPTLVIGDEYLVGSVEIPDKFPGLIEKYLAQGGVDWPDIPGLDRVLSSAQDSQSEATVAEPGSSTLSEGADTSSAEVFPVTTTAPSIVITPTQAPVNLNLSSDTNMDIWERMARDPLGNGLAIIVLAIMIASLIGHFVLFFRDPENVRVHTPTWLVPLLCVVGLGVASYLAYVELNEVSAVCGPIGDCNTVQQSEYARLLSVMPIGVLGVIAFIVMGMLWSLTRSSKARVANLASVFLYLTSLFGVVFSIYLTFLEPFVIGATCAWCLTSAILMTAMMWLVASRGVQAWYQLNGKILQRQIG